jgi:hypothetical protein
MPLSRVMSSAIVAVVTGVILVPATFAINGYLSRDHIGLEAVEIIPEVSSFHRDQQIWQKLTRSEEGFNSFYSEYQNWLSSQSTPVRTILFNEQNSISEHERLLLKDALQSYVEFLNRRLVEVQRLQDSWNKASGADELPVVDEIAMARVMVFARDPRDIMPPRQKVADGLKQKLDELQESRKLASDLAGTLGAFQESRTGDLTIHATFLNTGNTDGLVKPEATLKLVEREVAVPMTSCNGGMLKVTQRSVAEGWFKLDEVKAAKGDLADLRTIVKQGNSASGIVEAQDFRGSIVSSKRIPFPLLGASTDSPRWNPCVPTDIGANRPIFSPPGPGFPLGYVP